MSSKYYLERIQRAKDILGNECVKCGETERLEFDHIDPATKSFTIAGNVSRKLEDLKLELKKCQLLCHKCHWDKTALDKGHIRITDKPHGTLSAYYNYGCRCEECRKVERAYSLIRLRGWRKRRREALESAKSSV